VTGDASDNVRDQCLKAGAVSVIYKPIDRSLLLDTIRRFTAPSLKMTSLERRAVHSGLKKVLIVDDNPDLRTIFARSFDHRHFAVTIAADGIEAIERLEEEQPDILILDINMPRLSGFDVLRHLRENKRALEMKIVVVTGNTMTITAPQADLADLLLVKPSQH
jgi:CheY-like chemotaxis protein